LASAKEDVKEKPIFSTMDGNLKFE